MKQQFKGWGLNLQGELRKLRKELQEELITLENLEETNSLPTQLWQRKTQIISENLRLLKQEELYWYNRSHETWLLNGDLNTKYFHRVASGRKRKNTILSPEHGDITIDGDENLLAHATEYYSELFGPTPEFNVHLNNNIWDGVVCVSKIDKEQLCKPFSEV